MKLNRRKCKNCNKEFTKKQPLESVCSIGCAIDRSYALKKAKKEKESKEQTRELKKNLLTHKDYIKMLQIVFNSFIRERDKDLGCISCGVFNCEEFHAGHYIATTYQYHRFNENNVWKQCSKCNTHLRGNLILYRIGLIKKIGLEEVEYIENTRHMALEITIPEIQEQIKMYKLKLKNLKNGTE